MPGDVRRVFSSELKKAAVERVKGGEKVAALASELGVHRQLIYKWIDADLGGLLGRRRGRPTRAQALARAAKGDALEQAQRKIAELERKVGQQAVDLDFFRGALRRIEAPRQASDAPGVTGSSPRSRR
jgi:transposase-like protein